MAYKKKDYRYLVVGYDGYNDVEVPEEAEQRWTDIFDEWVKLTDNNSIIYYYQLISEVAYLETRFVVAQVLLLQIYEREMDEKTLDMYIEMLKNWRYTYKKGSDKVEELTRLFNQHKTSQNKLGIKRSELESLQKDNKENVQNLEAQAVTLEQITGRNNIDPKTTSVLKWNEICKVADSINAQRRKQYGK
jgi:hypothetical protein